MFNVMFSPAGRLGRAIGAVFRRLGVGGSRGCSEAARVDHGSYHIRRGARAREDDDVGKLLSLSRGKASLISRLRPSFDG